MPIRSLGFRTDLFFIRELSEVEEREVYTVARTPSNPGYYFGNFLMYDHSPAVCDEWLAAFRREFPAARHMAFKWQGAQGETAAFRVAGFEVESRMVLSASSTHAPLKYHEQLTVRPMDSQNDWESALEMQIRNRDLADQPDEGRYRNYKTQQMANYRVLQERGLGYWFGGFLNGGLVGSLGIYVTGDTARYQQVDVDSAHRRRGICGTIVHAAAQQIAAQFDPKTFVIVTNTDYHAAPIYESVGFRAVESEWSMCKHL